MDLTHSKVADAAPVLPRPGSKVRNEVPATEMRGNSQSELRMGLHKAAPRDFSSARKSLGYGLPCARCHLYYPASLDTCPCCNSKDRVSASLAPAIPKSAAATEPETDDASLEREREAFLQQFKSQLVAVAADMTRTPAICALSRLHPQTSSEPASICKTCYQRLQDRVDVLEAALHIDLKEAAQIVYNAVWADPSDPSKTYANAAAALLAELRKRAGVSGLLGRFQHQGN